MTTSDGYYHNNNTSNSGGMRVCYHGNGLLPGRSSSIAVLTHAHTAVCTEVDRHTVAYVLSRVYPITPYPANKQCPPY